jgi:aminoglycoside 6'-N-acetyltransferase
MRAPDEPLHGVLTTIRRATDDADLLVAWHADPEVARYWDDETYTRDEMLERLSRPDVDPYIIEHDGVAVGYLQAWFDDAVPSRAGLDMFLIPAARGRGFGPDAARTVVQWLLGPAELEVVTVDPYVSNARAIKAWAKAGFHPVEQRPPDHERKEGWLLMVTS